MSEGLGKTHEVEDNNIIRDLVVKRMTEALINNGEMKPMHGKI